MGAARSGSTTMTGCASSSATYGTSSVSSGPCARSTLSIHAAALKQVPACEYNPFEAVQTNVIGAENLVTAAIEEDVAKTLAISTDKAVNPVNLYGATKLCAEKIITQGERLRGTDSPVRFSSVRYGNVVGSRGSVIPLSGSRRCKAQLTITDEAMTRFWITLDHAVEFVHLLVSGGWRAARSSCLGSRACELRISRRRLPPAPSAASSASVQEKRSTRCCSRLRRRGTRPRSRSTSPSTQRFPFWRDAEYPRGEELPARL